MAVSDYGSDSLEGSQLLRCTLRIAPGYQDLRIGVQAVGATNECARSPIGLGRDAAGIHYDHVGLGWLTNGMAGRAQLFGDRFAIRAGGPATEMLHVKSGHTSSLVAIRREMRGLRIGVFDKCVRYTKA